MKKLFLFFLVMIINNSFACDFLSQKIELNKAKSKVIFKTENKTIPSICSDMKVKLKNKPDWIWFHKPRKSQIKKPFVYGLEFIGNKVPNKFELVLIISEKELTLDVELFAKNPNPNKKSSTYEKACGTLPYSFIDYL